MPLILLGVIILLIALLAPIIWGVLVWFFSNIVSAAIILIAVGVVYVVFKTIVKFVLFETEDSTGDYLRDESGNKIYKDWKGILEGVLVATLLASLLIFFISDWL